MNRSAAGAAGLILPTLALAAMLLGATKVQGQVARDTVQVSDSVAAATASGPTTLPDSLTQEVDSARLAILERLERLARPVGADSILYVQDSLRLAEAADGQRPGGGSDSIASALMRLPGYSLTEYDGEAADCVEHRLPVDLAHVVEHDRRNVVDRGGIAAEIGKRLKKQK